MNKALICGISGQDGAYLAKLLLSKNYLICGTSRDAEQCTFKNLVYLGIKDKIQLESMALNDFRSVLQVVVKFQPDEIYNLAGQTSVGLSFKQPVETLESIAKGTLNLLEVIRFTGKNIKYYNASSSECFGDIGDEPAEETTPFRPRSPYAVAKSTAFWEVANYREAYNVFACSGILFNHESPLRSKRFVTQKIVETVFDIYQKKATHLDLGNLNIIRDWGWAEEYVKAMYLMLQKDEPDDYVIATGISYSLKDFVEEAFRYFNLNWYDYVTSNSELLRPTDLSVSRGNPEKAQRILGWNAHYQMPDVVKMMIESKISSN